MNKQLQINYYWNCDQEIDIPKAHEEALEEDALLYIFTMIKNGYREGELNTGVRLGKDRVPEEYEMEGLTYSGWWRSVKTDNDER